jgi:dTDP-4-dehydrorhamnose 3,5-epimerase
MRFERTPVEGVLIIGLEPREDERGFFARTWCDHEARAHGLEVRWVQGSISYNARRGTLRGLHYQLSPHEETKLVRCTRGSVYDVVLDVRPQSPSFGRHVAVVLNSTNRLAVYVPAGCAHGFQTLEDDTEVAYQISEIYAPGSAAGVRWDDPVLGIQWPVPSPILSDRDRALPDFPGLAVAPARSA